MASECAASSGLISASSSWTPGVVSEASWFSNTTVTRRSTAPERSSATTVLAKVGGSGSATIAATSASWSAMPRSNAGR